jgi:HlyD family secretion protein
MQGSSSEKRNKRARKSSRRVAAERLSTPDQLDQVIEVVRFPHWLLLCALILLLITALAASFFIRLPIKVLGEGILINIEGILTVTSDTEGRLVELMVKPGQRIQAGELVARIAQPRLSQQLEARREELEEVLDQKETIKAFQSRMQEAKEETIANKGKALRQRMKFANSRLELLQEQLHVEETLQNDGIIAERKLNETRTAINEAKDNVTSISNELEEVQQVLGEQRLGHQREILDLDLQINDLERQVIGLEEELQRRSEVHSPYHGRVVELQVNRGEIVERNGPLVSLLPLKAGALESSASRPSMRAPGISAPTTGELVAVLYVPPADGKKIHPGMEVQVAPTSVKRERYGFMIGIVESVAEVPSTEEGMMRILKNHQLVQQLSQTYAPFEVMVRLELNPATDTGYSWSTSRGPDVEMNVGTLCLGEIITRKERPISLLLPALGRWFDD